MKSMDSQNIDVNCHGNGNQKFTRGREKAYIKKN